MARGAVNETPSAALPVILLRWCLLPEGEHAARSRGRAQNHHGIGCWVIFSGRDQRQFSTNLDPERRAKLSLQTLTVPTPNSQPFLRRTRATYTQAQNEIEMARCRGRGRLGAVVLFVLLGFGNSRAIAPCSDAAITGTSAAGTTAISLPKTTAATAVAFIGNGNLRHVMLGGTHTRHTSNGRRGRRECSWHWKGRSPQLGLQPMTTGVSPASPRRARVDDAEQKRQQQRQQEQHSVGRARAPRLSKSCSQQHKQQQKPQQQQQHRKRKQQLHQQQQGLAEQEQGGLSREAFVKAAAGSAAAVLALSLVSHGSSKQQ